MIYGITGFAIHDLTISGKDAECTVSFWYWLPVSESATDATAKQNQAGKAAQATEANGKTQPDEILLSVYAYSDRVSLEYLKDRWKISGIHELRRELVTDNGQKLVEAIAAGTAKTLPFAPEAAEIEKAKATMKQPN
jgi:hypothetical protein